MDGSQMNGKDGPPPSQLNTITIPQLGLLDRVAVEEKAVCAAQVPNPPVPIVGCGLGMEPAHLRGLELNLTLRVPAQTEGNRESQVDPFRVPGLGTEADRGRMAVGIHGESLSSALK